ncbi:MAG: PorP/SprF family type IX secretion system membrane protein [Bacteroidales bacterium]|nr:PorP/SprF family type IX secretion system membrane protein [Bacteroidales bacterium]
MLKNKETKFSGTKILIKLSVIFVLIAITKTSISQETRLSFVNFLKFNPAIMGESQNAKLTLNYCDQWNSVQKGYKTYTCNFTYPLILGDNATGKNKLDLGFCGQNFSAGAFDVLDFSLSVGYNLPLAESNFLSAAISAGYVQKALDLTELTFDEQFVAGSYNAANFNGESIINKKASFMDMNFGLLWYYKPDEGDGKINSYLGISGFHLNQPNESFNDFKSPLPTRYVGFGGVKIIGEKVDVTPNLIYFSQEDISEFGGGVYVDYKLNESNKFSIGLWYKNNDAFCTSICIERKLFALSYSFDLTTSDIKTYMTGLNANVISLIFKFNKATESKLSTSPFPLF